MDSFIGWIGGKKLLRKVICERFPENVKKYVEVFGGAGWLLFYKDKHAPFEVYNDINSQLVNLFKCIKFHPDAVKQEMKYILNSRELFHSYKTMDTSGMTDIQRAARYLFLIRASYGSKVNSYGAKPRNIGRLDCIDDIQKRLASVVIENKGFDALIKQYDSPDTLFYCDPPYYGSEYFYTESFDFDIEQHKKMREILGGVKGKFVLSYNDCPLIRELYDGYTIEEAVRQLNLASKYGAKKTYKELIIKNY